MALYREIEELRISISYAAGFMSVYIEHATSEEIQEALIAYGKGDRLAVSRLLKRGDNNG